jgi:hypothetical protein
MSDIGLSFPDCVRKHGTKNSWRISGLSARYPGLGKYTSPKMALIVSIPFDFLWKIMKVFPTPRSNK